MLEGLAAWILRTYVGEYVENLNTDQLSIGYGGIELENLTLKKTALQGFELPIEVRSGFIGRLKLEIPYSRPKSQPWIICIDKLYIVAGPPLSPASKKEALEKDKQLNKQQQLDALENQWKATREKQGSGWWSDSWWPSLYSSFSTTVAENLQLVISNVHFRYEDSTLAPEKPFAIGITIGNLAAQSTDKEWEAKFLYSDDTIKYKLIELTGLAMYWDDYVEEIGKLPAKKIRKALESLMKRNDGSVQSKGHTFILEPVSAKAKMKRNSSNAPLLAKDGPRFDVEFLLQNIALSLSHGQLSGFFMLLDEIQRYFKLQRNSSMRPDVPVSKSPSLWWRFAIDCHLRPIKERNERCTKAFIMQRVTDIILYTKAYTEHLTNPVIGPETMSLRKAVEEKLSFEELRILRNLVTSRIAKEENLRKAADKTAEIEKNAEGKDSWGGWLTGWTSWYGYEAEAIATGPDDVATAGKVTFKEPVSAEEEEFLGELAEAGQDESVFKRDHVFVQLNFKLKCGKLQVENTNQFGSCVPVAELEFSEVQWTSEMRPKSNSWQFSATLGAMFLRDLYSENTLFPVLVQAQDQNKIQSKVAVPTGAKGGDGISGLASLIEEKVPLLEISFEQRPAGIRDLNRCSIKLQPLTVIYNADVMLRLSEFLKPSHRSKFEMKAASIESKLQKMVMERYKELKDSTKTEFIHSLDELMIGEAKKTNDKWDLELDIAAPLILLPESFVATETSMVILDLGRISFINAPALQRQRSESSGHGQELADSGDEDEFLTPLSTPPDDEDFERLITAAAFSEETEDLEALKEKFYERYQLKFTHLQVIVCKCTDNWSLITKQNKSSFHIVDSFSISLNMERRLAFTSDPNWPAVTLSGSLPQLMVHIDEQKIGAVFSCISQLQEERKTLHPIDGSSHRPSYSDLSAASSVTDFAKLKESRPPVEPSTPHKEISVLHKRARDLLVESCLAVANFKIDEVCLRLNTRGRCVAEMQIGGVETEYTKRPYDYSVSFVLRSLLIVDALQTFGPEYKLLVSSQKAASATKRKGVETDALIRINYQQVDKEIYSSEASTVKPQRIASLNFNSIDVIANQETIVELIAVVNHALHVGSGQKALLHRHDVKDSETSKETIELTSSNSIGLNDDESITQVDLNVQRINIILARGVSSNFASSKVARQVAAVTIADLDFSAELGNSQTIRGSLGGIEVLDQTPECLVHRCILSIGECKQDMSENERLRGDSECKAFQFSFTKAPSSEAAKVNIDSHIASACYVHSAEFLSELSLCAGDFRDYAAAAAKSIQTAAVDVAKEFVSAKIKDELVEDEAMADIDSRPVDGRSMETGRFALFVCIETPVIVIPRSFNSLDLLVGNLGRITIRNMQLNETDSDHGMPEGDSSVIVDRIFLDISNVSLYSITLKQNHVKEFSAGKSTLDFLRQKTVSASTPFASPHRSNRKRSQLASLSEEITDGKDFSFKNEGGNKLEWIEILHETGFQLVIDRIKQSKKGNTFSEIQPSKGPSLQIDGKMLRAVRLEFSSRTYNQVLETLNSFSTTPKQGSLAESQSRSQVHSSSHSAVTSPTSMSSRANTSHDGQEEQYSLDDDFIFPPEIDITGTMKAAEEDEPTITHTSVNASFEIAGIDLILSVEIQGKERKFANILLEDFVLGYNNSNKPRTEVSVVLGGLFVEDLLHEGDPAYRYLIKSSNSGNGKKGQNLGVTDRLSISCPEASSFYDCMIMSTSLPSVLHNSPQKLHTISPLRPMMHSDKKFPSQPQLLSNRGSGDDDDDDNEIESSLCDVKEESWVKINLLLIDEEAISSDENELFVTKYIDVAFNSLDLTVNLQTWVVVFEFFGIGAPPPPPTGSAQPSPTKSLELSSESSERQIPSELIDTEPELHGTNIKVSMKSLSATLNKERYPLAKAIVSNLIFDVEQRGPDQEVAGSIGYISLSDMSPHGTLYRERFITYGTQALAFTFFRYGDPDPFLKRDLDMKLELKMASVQYVHTQRFLSEVIAFAQHFLQLQEVLGRMRAASEGNEVFAITNRAARVSLDIDADAPILILPRSSASSDILVACLGHIIVANTFQYAGSPDSVSGKLTASRFRLNQGGDGTAKLPRLISHDDSIADSDDRLLDCMNIGLVDMEVFTALRTGVSEHRNMSFGYERQGGKLMKETCRIELIVERNLEWAFGRQVPDMTISGKLSSVYVTLDLAQFGLVMGMLGENLGEPFEQFERPSSVLVDPLQETSESDAVWTTLSMSLNLVNVSVEMIPKFSFGKITSIENAPCFLGRLDFVQSRFMYESFSDGSKSIDLVSHGVLLHDIRGKDNEYGNVFTRILEPSDKYDQSFHDRTLQFEVHYLDAKDKTHITCLFNRSKIIVILDFLMEIWNFITRKEENEFIAKSEIQVTTKKEEAVSPSSADVHLPSGVITKASTTPRKTDAKSFELKINMTDTEIVVVENNSSMETAAVILKTTAVLAYRPNHFSERPLTVSLQSLEVFSCQLANIDETALSIIDPVTVLVELNSAVKLKNQKVTKGLLGATQSMPTLEVHFHSQLNVRLSYHDVKLFLRIFESAQRQINKAIEKPGGQVNEQETIMDIIETVDNEDSLLITQKPIYTDEQALGLDLSADDVKEIGGTDGGTHSSLAGFEVTGTALSFCLIDDCGNNDIPLVEIVFNNLYLWHDLQHTGEGSSHATVMADYYNRNVSGWEPFIEPWKCTVHWHNAERTSKKGACTLVKVHAPERLDMNLTVAFMEMIYTTKSAWTEDYLNESQFAEGNQSAARKRAPFVPFLLRNKTGCKLWFGTLTTSPAKAVGNADRQDRKKSTMESFQSWKEVKADDEVPMTFESRDKMRHKGTHKLKVHQIVVQVDGWQPSTPISVDKVGDFFRHVAPLQEVSASSSKQLPIRLVFAVSLEGARKVVTVRSSLIISNKLNVPVEVWAEKVSEDSGVTLPALVPGTSLPVPVSYVQWGLYVRPKLPTSFDFCKDRLEWRDVVKPHEGRGYLRECHGRQRNLFRFSCYVQREGFPMDKASNFSEAVEQKIFMHPGHIINIVHHLVLINLLPVELSYIIKGVAVRERIKPGKSVPLHNVDLRNTFEIGFSFECHTRFEYVRISTRYRVDPAVIPIKLLDTKGRPLILSLKIEHEMSSAKVSVFAPYWLVNKTGLPLIFRREGESAEAAGQFEEHESARSLTPLLFSYVDEESMFRCQMRIGKNLYTEQPTTPVWGNSFSLETVRDHRTLYVKQGSNKPEITYDIGIDSVYGQGQLSCTRVVSLVTKYQLENRSKHTLAFAQRHVVKGKGAVTPNGCVVSLPAAITLFHWPRTDFDPLLCVRLHDVDHCCWSGGFKIDTEGSFHVNMRSTKISSFIFLRVEVVLEGATFHIILADTDRLPPPFRIDNLSKVEVTFWQENNPDMSERCLLKPLHSVPYALDEPSLNAKLAVSVFEEMSEAYDMMMLSRNLPRLYYQNAIYIAIGTTFSAYHCMTDDCNHGDFVCFDESNKDRNLVLDVIDGHKVVLSRKVLHKRSQLWRMNARGQLLHVGSSSPFDPRQTSPKGKKSLVLDISANYSEKRGFAQLVLGRSDPQREMTQSWFFEDGMLRCGLTNMAVRPQDGVPGLKEGHPVVLAQLKRRTSNKLPAEYCLCRHKLRPGSGALAVRILTDGPTRVVRITDACDDMAGDSDQDWTLVERLDTSKFVTLYAQRTPNDTELELSISLAHGFGISLINSVPEEIIFATFSRIQLDYLNIRKNKTVDLVIGNIQIDNQLFGSSNPVILFPTPLVSKAETVKEAPALELSICLEDSTFANVNIYRKFDFSLRKMTILLEDRTLFKLLQFFGTAEESDKDLQAEDFHMYNSQRILESRNKNMAGKKLYLERLMMGGTEAKLSLLAVGRLTPDLQKIKRNLGVPIVSLEDANIELTSFKKEHLFDRTDVIIDQFKRHYSDVIRGQAASVLGSLDILGNPMGLIHDVSTGMEGLVKRGNLGGLIVNVAHGLSDTAAKMTGSIADGLWSASMDQRLQESRGVMRAERGSSSGDHLLAGFKGLGMGVIGGLTSIVTQPIEGASRRGVQGFFTGIGKGIVGTVAKPAAGVLDLASGAAAAVRGSARGKQYVPKPVRLKKNCYDAGGVLPSYSKSMAEGQDVLLRLNDCEINERFVASELVRSDKDDRLRSIITTDGVYFVKAKGPPSPESVVLHLEYSELYDTKVIKDSSAPVPGGRAFIELIMRRESNGDYLPSRNPDKRPRVRCDSQTIANKVSDKINYMKSLYAEKQLTVIHEKTDAT